MLSSPLGRAWRIWSTGFAFAIFGLTALLLSITVCPLLALTASRPSLARARIQFTLHLACRGFIYLIRALGLVSYELHGIERLARSQRVAPQGQLILANHPSLIDAVFLLAWTPEAVCIVKQALHENPFLRRAVSWSGYVGNATPAQLVRDCVSALRDGHSLIMFPEGTRSVPGAPRRFKRGAAWIALRSGAAIVPVIIRCEPSMLTKGAKWWQVPARPGHFTLVVGAPLLAADEVPADLLPGAQAARLTARLEQLLDPERIGHRVAAPALSLH